jgi:hypothetical protein
MSLPRRRPALPHPKWMGSVCRPVRPPLQSERRLSAADATSRVPSPEADPVLAQQRRQFGAH